MEQPGPTGSDCDCGGRSWEVNNRHPAAPLLPFHEHHHPQAIPPYLYLAGPDPQLLQGQAESKAAAAFLDEREEKGNCVASVPFASEVMQEWSADTVGKLCWGIAEAMPSRQLSNEMR